MITEIDAKAVIFDVYGTLFISEAGDIGLRHSENGNLFFSKAFTRCGFFIHGDDFDEKASFLYHDIIRKVHRRFLRSSILYPEVDIIRIWDEVVSILVSTGYLSPPFDPEQILYLAVEYETLNNKTSLMPNAIEVIHTLKQAGRILGIISNAQFYTPFLFSSFFSKDLQEIGFDPRLCIWSYQFGESKPSPLLFSELFNRLVLYHNIKGCSEVLYIGNDMKNDILGANQAGFKTALFAGDSRSLRLREEDISCKNQGPGAIITDLRQVLDLLKIQTF